MATLHLRHGSPAFTIACALMLGTALGGPTTRAAPAPAPGYVDGAPFRALVDESKEVVEINLEGAILQALASKTGDGGGGPEAKDLFGKLRSIHAVIGTVKGPASAAMGVVQKLDQKLVSAGWQRVTRIKDESSWISVLTHTSGETIDGLVTLIFDSADGGLVFANLAGEIDIDKLGEIGDRLNVPGLDRLPSTN